MSIRDRGPVTVVRLTGDLTHRELSRLEQTLRELMRQNRFRIVMNLRHVRHLDYSGLPPLFHRAERLRACNGDLRLVGLSPYLKSLFSFSGLGEAFRVYNSEREARLSFGSDLTHRAS